jgi:anthranilate phosphoribosyltransferase
MINAAIKELSEGKNLDAAQMETVTEEIMSGKVDTPAIVDFLTALDKKGETVEELTAAVAVMRRHVKKVKIEKEIILDTCGTGGDKKGTFNVSTVVAFVASGCEITVAKHGNRSVSSCCGSADILEALGININLPPEKVEKSLNEIGIAFLFAPNFHPAMKYAMPARKQIGKRTMFNILGPLTNPAGATHQLVGVFAAQWTEVLARVLMNLGTVHVLVVYGRDGLDEITTTAATLVSEGYKGKINNYEIKPEDFGFQRARPQDLLGGTALENSQILLEVLKGKPGPKRDIVVLNAAAAIYAADKAESIAEGIKLAGESIDSGRALKKLELFKKYSR